MGSPVTVIRPYTIYYPDRSEHELSEDEISMWEGKHEYNQDIRPFLDKYMDGAWMEVIRPTEYPEVEMIVDEDGQMKGLPVNRVGSVLYGAGYICGPVVLLPAGTIK